MTQNIEPSLGKLTLAIPTYRSGEIAQTVSRYAHNFSRYNHRVPIFVFDDSDRRGARISEGSLRVAAKRFPGQEVRYVGPHEKAKFLHKLGQKLGPEHEDTIRRIFRPSYGGNRNFVLAYTLGNHFISVDDDMTPKGIFTGKSVSYSEKVISQGRFLLERDIGAFPLVDQDIVGGYRKFLGTKVGDHLGKVIMGGKIKDPNIDNLGFTTGDLESSVLMALPGEIREDATIKIVQSHLTGDADVDSADLVKIFMKTGVGEILSGHLPKKHVLDACSEAVVSCNNRLTGAILGYDNSNGGIYFLPTTFRCEDFIWRMHLESMPAVASAYTAQAQTHSRSVSVRNSVVADWYNELTAQVIKELMRESVSRTGTHSMEFDSPREVSIEVAEEIESLLRKKRDQAITKSMDATENAPNFLRFAGELDSILNDDIESPEKFASGLSEVIREEFTWFNRTSAIWPKVLESSYEMRRDLPMVDITRESRKLGDV
ncbi:hypothetical protein K8R33_00345 [archaeon]|nr:hypothetical protein [archaeon]